jgi:hypothetical protein
MPGHCAAGCSFRCRPERGSRLPDIGCLGFHQRTVPDTCCTTASQIDPAQQVCCRPACSFHFRFGCASRLPDIDCLGFHQRTVPDTCCTTASLADREQRARCAKGYSYRSRSSRVAHRQGSRCPDSRRRKALDTCGTTASDPVGRAEYSAPGNSFHSQPEYGRRLPDISCLGFQQRIVPDTCCTTAPPGILRRRFCELGVVSA